MLVEPRPVRLSADAHLRLLTSRELIGSMWTPLCHAPTGAGGSSTRNGRSGCGSYGTGKALETSLATLLSCVAYR